jgi:predicted porin
MHKKALIVAVAAALAVPAAFAKGDSDSSVELYGKVYPELVFPSGSGATAAGSAVSTIAGTPSGTDSIVKRTEMSSSNTRFGIRGHEKLGRSLQAIFQLETAFAVDSNNTKFAQRNSFVGLADKGWGTIKFGRMDTPFKKTGDHLSFLGVSSGNFVSTSSLLRKTGFGTNSASSFHLRRQNAVQYESPNWGGIKLALQYSTDETKTATRDPHVISAGLAWARGPWYAGLAFEQHWDLFGGSRNVHSNQSNFGDQHVNSKDKAVQGTIKYKFGVHTLEADYITKKYDENASTAGRFSSYKNNAWLLNWNARWSKSWATQIYYLHADKGSCSLVDAVCSTDGLDGTTIALGGAYYFSKKTYLFFLASWLKNGSSARFNNSDLQDPSVGEDIRQYAVGLSTAF